MGIDRTLVLKSTFQTNLLNEKFEAIALSVNRKNLNFALVKLKFALRRICTDTFDVQRST